VFFASALGFQSAALLVVIEQAAERQAPRVAFS
jgi:hypothetical protein